MRPLTTQRSPSIAAVCMVLALLAAAAGLAAPAAAQFDVVNWTFSAPDGGTGSLSADEMSIVGPDDGPCSGGSTALYTAVAPVDGVVVAHASFYDADKFAGADLFAVVENGVASDQDDPYFQGTLVLHVTAGETFGFGVHSLDCIYGPGILVVDGFLFQPDVPAVALSGTQASEKLGTSLAPLGDLDGDGTPELVAGAPGQVVAGVVKGGARVVAGTLDRTLFSVSGDQGGDFFGQAVASAGDVDGDGVPDVIVGAPRGDAIAPPATDAGYARVFSGSDGSTLLTVYGTAAFDALGSAVAGVGDLDGDGRADIAVGVPFNDLAGADAGLVRVHSGATGSLLYQIAGAAPGDHFGSAIAGVGDLDGDGVPDLLVGAPGSDVAYDNAGRVTAHSGASGALLAGWNGWAKAAAFGSAVATAGDVDADGVGDFIVGAPGAVIIPVGSVGGRATVISGNTGGVIFEVPPTGKAPDDSHDALGASVGAAGDVDDDGYDDVLIGAPRKPVLGSQVNPGRVLVVSGRTHALIDLVEGAIDLEQFGSAVAGLGDVDGDGWPDLASGAPSSDVAATDAGVVRVVPIVVPWADLGHALPGTAGSAVLEGHGLLAAGTKLTLKLSHALPGGSASLVLGFSLLSAPFKGGVLVPFPNLLVPGLPLDGTGALSLSTTWPSGVPAGSSIWLQAWFADGGAPLGIAASNGLRATVP